MQYRSLDQIAVEADVRAAADLPTTTALSRRERLERWAEILEQEPRRLLRAMHDVEYRSPQELISYRVDGSPLSVAYADPVLRVAGLRSDTVGDAGQFFGLSHEQLHYLLCFCHHGEMLTGSATAAQVRTFARPMNAYRVDRIGIGIGAALATGLALASALF
jgi:hypothetical protein